MDAVKRPVQNDGPPGVAVIKLHLEAAADRYDQLVASPVGMCAAILAGRDIVDIKHPLHGERKVDTVLQDADIALPVLMAGKGQEGTIVNRCCILHWFIC